MVEAHCKPAWLLVIALIGAVFASTSALASQVTQDEYGAFKRSAGGQAQFDIDFVVDRMQKGQPIAESSVDAFEAIAKGGPNRYGAMLTPQQAQQTAGLLDRYGQRGTADSLRQAWQVATPSGRGFGEVESDLGKLDRPTGSHTYREGNQVVVQDPPGGMTIRNLAKSCFWRSSTPAEVAEPDGRYVQKLSLPSTQEWKRLVERSTRPDEQDIIDRYQIQHVVLNAKEGEVTANRFRAYVFGKKIIEERNESVRNSDGSYYTKHVSNEVEETPSWRVYSCSTAHVRA